MSTFQAGKKPPCAQAGVKAFNLMSFEKPSLDFGTQCNL